MNIQRTRINHPFHILVAEDDPDDQMLIHDAFEANNLGSSIRFVENGEELLDYIFQREKYADPSAFPPPDMIILDLNMPKKDGRETLREIKNNEHLRPIPVIVLTTSNSQDDISKLYHLGVNSYIVKPFTFDGLINIVKCIDDFWFKTARLPFRTDQNSLNSL